tara:strand:- start:622 stop:1143 length:522 start_codon:yes stop_codon:yes gene_type:complete
MNDLDPLQLGKDIHTLQQNPNYEEADLQEYLMSAMDEMGWFDDTWVDSEDKWGQWWAHYGDNLTNLSGTWDQDLFDMNKELRDIEIEEFQTGFMPSEYDLGATGFAQASNIGTAGNLGGGASWVEEYQSGMMPIETKFTRGQETAWDMYGQSYLDMITTLMQWGAFSEDAPDT